MRRPSKHEKPPPAQLPSSDAGWKRKCAPLLQFIAAPRTWTELLGWAVERNVSGSRLRNMLAWLEQAGKAGSFDPWLSLPGPHGGLAWRSYGGRVRPTDAP